MLDIRFITSIVRRTLPIFSILIACSCALWAQPDGPGGPPPDGPPPGQSMQQRGPSVDHELKQLTQLLTLTTDQQTQVKTILTDQHLKIEALIKQSMPSTDSAPQPPSREAMEAMHDSMKAIRDASNTRIAALLSDDQKARFAAWEKKHARSSQQGNDMPPPPDGGEGGPPPDGGGGSGGPGDGGPPGI